jgi:tetratricopeptide (TPR) repeat protein
MALIVEKRLRAEMLLTAALMMVLSSAVAGQDVTRSGTVECGATDSVPCHEMISIYRSAQLQGDNLAALEYWRTVLAGCPDASEEIYTDGETLFREMFDLTGSREYIDSIMMILTQRSHYFSNRAVNELHKTDLLMDLAGDDPEYLGLCYNILIEAAESNPDQLECSHFVRLATVAASLYAMGIIDSGEMRQAFITSIGTVDHRIESGAVNCSNAEDLQNMETFYRTSGAMTCEGLETLYSGKVDRNFRDAVFLGKVNDMLNEAGCSSSGLYYNVAVKMFANDRSVENALRLAELNIARNDSDRALSYFTEAYNRDTSRISRSAVLNRIALADLRQGRRQEARNRAEHAWQLNNRNARALMILAECYAGAELGSSFDNHTAYWVAVDYLESAVKADPSLRQEAEPKFRAWSQLFPTREECFYRRILNEGAVFTVGGWVNEVTRVRFRKE